MNLRKRLPRRLLAAFVALLLLPTHPAEPDPSLEYKVKAGYLFNFAKFVEWPASAFPATNSPFVIAVLDTGEATPALTQSLAGKEFAGRSLDITRAASGDVPASAHILFVTRSAGTRPEDLRARLGNAPILLVGETDGFAERGGAIGFFREGDSIRFAICLEHANAQGLKISARLSSVAKPVRSRSKP
jgi:YfiR/HmsC-like